MVRVKDSTMPRYSSTFCLVAFAALTACASNTGVIDIGQNQFVIERQQATGASGLGNLRAEVYAEANAYCSSRGDGLETVTYEQTEPPYILGNFPRVSLTFRCV
jgi:putative hemolysin